MAEILWQRLPLGFRFRPTDEEIINHYLKRKITGNIDSDMDVIPEVDVCKYEPWHLPGKSLIKLDDCEWLFYSPKDRKYPKGCKSNRATDAGYWKATGKDRDIMSKPSVSGKGTAIGTKKTLVFHTGRAPKGFRTNWTMHEYRTTEPEFESGEQGGYVLYKLIRKPEENLSTNRNAMGSPVATRITPSNTRNDAVAVEELGTPVNMELQEVSHGIPSVQEPSAGIKRRLSVIDDCSPSCPVTLEENCGSSHQNDQEEAIPQGLMGVDSSDWLSDSILLSQPSFQMGSSDDYPLIEPPWSAIYENTTLLPYDNTGADVAFDSGAESIQHLLDSMEESSHKVDDKGVDEGTGITIRSRPAMNPPVTDCTEHHQEGNAARRVLLQTSINRLPFSGKSEDSKVDDEEENIEKSLSMSLSSEDSLDDLRMETTSSSAQLESDSCTNSGESAGENTTEEENIEKSLSKSLSSENDMMSSTNSPDDLRMKTTSPSAQIESDSCTNNGQSVGENTTEEVGENEVQEHLDGITDNSNEVNDETCSSNPNHDTDTQKMLPTFQNGHGNIQEFPSRTKMEMIQLLAETVVWVFLVFCFMLTLGFGLCVAYYIAQ